jgi:hypothetical protein
MTLTKSIVLRDPSKTRQGRWASGDRMRASFERSRSFGAHETTTRWPAVVDWSVEISETSSFSGNSF